MKKVWEVPKIIELKVSKVTMGTKAGSSEAAHGCGSNHAPSSSCR